jgi:endonuclease YncB( thermonuclease family)
MRRERRMFAKAVMGIIVALLLTEYGLADRIQPDQIRVLDADTIRIDRQKPDVRLVGYNAPETRRAKCERERAAGAIATKRLRSLVQDGDLDLKLVECSCPQGTAGTLACNWGRKCGTLKAKGRDVGDILIAENLAVPFVCGKTRCPQIPKPWCN